MSGPWFSYVLFPLCPIRVPIVPTLSTQEVSRCLQGEVFPDLPVRNSFSCQLSQPFLKASLKTLFFFFIMYVICLLVPMRLLFSQLLQSLECGMFPIYINESMNEVTGTNPQGKAERQELGRENTNRMILYLREQSITGLSSPSVSSADLSGKISGSFSCSLLLNNYF